MRKFENFTDFRFNMELVPFHIALDVIVRINDWIVSGGNLEDNYVKRQLEYASDFIYEENPIERL